MSASSGEMIRSPNDANPAAEDNGAIGWLMPVPC
jgi:hypothetical protein